MNSVYLYAVIYLLALLKITVLTRAGLNGLTPDVLVVAVIFAGLYMGKGFGVKAGIFAGLVNDVLSSMPFGLGLVGYGSVGFVAGRISKRFYKESIVTQVVFTFVAAVFCSILSYLIKICFLINAPFLTYGFIGRMLVHALYTAAIAPLFFFVMFKMFGFKESPLWK